MKTILAILLLGVAYATASPSCPKDDYIRCFKYIPGSEDDAFRETEKYLDSTCEQFGCAVRYQKACGYPDNQPATISSFKLYKKVYDAICEKDSSIRRKYLKNVPCLNRVTISMGHKCKLMERLVPEDPEYCPNIEDYFYCIRDGIRKGCSKVAGEVYDAIAPGMDLFGC